MVRLIVAALLAALSLAARAEPALKKLGPTNGRPANRYCYVEGTCEGPGC